MHYDGNQKMNNEQPKHELFANDESQTALSQTLKNRFWMTEERQ